MSENSAAPVSASVESIEAPVTDASESNEQVEVSETPAAPQPPAKRKYSYKADGEEVSEELDDAEITRRLSLAKGAHKRMNESAKVRMQAEALIREFHENPTALFKKLDATKARSAAEQYLLEQIQEEMMSPEQKQQREMMQKLQAYEEQERRSKEEAEAQQMTALQERFTTDYANRITDALAQSGLPKVPATVKRMAQLMHTNLELGLDLTPQDLVEEVKKSYYSEFKEMFGAADASFILSMFGDDVANKVRKHDLERLRSGMSQPQQSQQFISKTEEAPRKMRGREYDEYLRRKIGAK